MSSQARPIPRQIAVLLGLSNMLGGCSDDFQNQDEGGAGTLTATAGGNGSLGGMTVSPGAGGGSMAVGGSGAGGASPLGGQTGVGGAVANGGNLPNGGTPSSGGAITNGGSFATGGNPTSGGQLGVGGLLLGNGGMGEGGFPLAGGAPSGGGQGLGAGGFVFPPSGGFDFSQAGTGSSLGGFTFGQGGADAGGGVAEETGGIVGQGGRTRPVGGSDQGGTAEGGSPPEGGAPEGGSGTGGTDDFWPGDYNYVEPNPGRVNLNGHYAGQDCIQCHGRFPFAGSASGQAQIGISDGTNTITVYTHSSGAFWTNSGNIDWQNAEIRIRNANGDEAIMPASETASSNCNQCHSSIQVP